MCQEQAERIPKLKEFHHSFLAAQGGRTNYSVCTGLRSSKETPKVMRKGIKEDELH